MPRPITALIPSIALEHKVRIRLFVALQIGKKFVAPECSQPGNPAWWGGRKGQKDFEGPGNCQVCKTTRVETENHGMQCCNRGHHVCWSCLVKGINWEKAIIENPELFIQDQMAVVNDNLEIDAKGWRGLSNFGSGWWK